MARMFHVKRQPKIIQSLRNRRVLSLTYGSDFFEKAMQIYSLCAVRMVLVIISPAKSLFICFSDGDTTANCHQDGDQESPLGLNECFVQGDDNQLMKWSQFYSLMATPVELLQPDEITGLTSILKKASKRINIVQEAIRNATYTPDDSQAVNNPRIPSSVDTLV